MPLLILIALFLPRLVIALLWIFSQWFTGVFSHWLLPIVGFLFLPYTMLWYSAMHHWYADTWGGLQIVVLVIAVAADLGLFGKAGSKRS